MQLLKAFFLDNEKLESDFFNLCLDSFCFDWSPAFTVKLGHSRCHWIQSKVSDPIWSHPILAVAKRTQWLNTKHSLSSEQTASRLEYVWRQFRAVSLKVASRTRGRGVEAGHKRNLSAFIVGRDWSCDTSSQQTAALCSLLRAAAEPPVLWLQHFGLHGNLHACGWWFHLLLEFPQTFTSATGELVVEILTLSPNHARIIQIICLIVKPHFWCA